MFEGKDYSKETTEQDKDAFDRLLAGENFFHCYEKLFVGHIEDHEYS